MVGAILGIVFDDEDRRVIPVRTVRDRFDHAADRQIVVRDRGRGAWLAGRRAVGVIVRQIEKHECRQLGSLAFLAGANEILKLVEEKIGAKLVRIFRVEVRDSADESGRAGPPCWPSCAFNTGTAQGHGLADP